MLRSPSGDLQMIISIPRHAYTSDLVAAGKMLLPEGLHLASGDAIDLTMHGGKLRGRLTVKAKAKNSDWRLCSTWACPGSQFDGREFLLLPGAVSEIAGIGQPRMVPSLYQLV